MALNVSAKLDSGNYDGRGVRLGLTVNIDGVTSFDPEMDWNERKLVHGREVAGIVTDQVIPGLLAQLGLSPSAAVESNLTAKNEWTGKSDITSLDVDDCVLYVRQTTSAVFDIQADRNMQPGDIIAAARDMIANVFETAAVFALEQRFEGKQTGDTEWQIDREDERITGYKRTDTPQKPGGDQPAPPPSRRH